MRSNIIISFVVLPFDLFRLLYPFHKNYQHVYDIESRQNCVD